MAQIVKLRRSSVSGQKPTNDNLQLGELAVNTTDGKVFLAKSGSLGPTIEEIVTTNTINTGSINLIGGITVSGDISGSNIKGNSLTVSNGIQVSGSLMVSQSLIQYSSVTSVPSGSVTDVMSFNTGSYTAAFFDFVITSGSNSRAGTIFTNWNGNNIEYTETSTNDIGDTTSIQLSTSLTSGLLKLQATSIMGSWSVKTLARII